MTPEFPIDDHVLILGDPADPMVLQWRNYCEGADIPSSLYIDPEEMPEMLDMPFTAVINTHVEIPFFHLHHLPDRLYDRLADDCLMLSNCLAETPSATAAELDDGQPLVGFSGIGLYTNNPVLEIARADQTDAVYVKKAHALLHRLGLQAIEVPEMPGLILGRVLAMLVNEATSALMEGVANVGDIDAAMRLGTNYPYGPLTWADYVGLDVILAILCHLGDEYGEERYSPMPLLRQKVDAGKLGRKTGEGFFSYHPESLPRL